MSIKLWIRAMRAPFFIATAMPGVLGAAMAWSREGMFSFTYLILTLLGVAAINAGTNLANDYFDHQHDWTGTDDINKENNPFGGGSHVIQEKLLTPRAMLIAAFIAYAIAAIIGIYLILKVGTFILVLGAIGIFIGYFYTAPPFRFSYRGLGELAVGLACGVLPVLGSYYVQTGKITMEAFIVSIPMGFLITNLLWLNQFPDYEADKKGGKRTLVVQMGREQAIRVYYLLIVGIYIIIVAGVLFGVIPVLGGLSLVSLPLALKAMKIARSNYTKTLELIPAMASGIQLPMVIAILMSIGYIIDRII